MNKSTDEREDLTKVKLELFPIHLLFFEIIIKYNYENFSSKGSSSFFYLLIKNHHISPNRLSLLPNPHTSKATHTRSFQFHHQNSIMEDFRSKSCRDGRLEIYYGGGPPTSSSFSGPTSMQDLRCYSANHVNDLKLKKVKNGGGVVGSISKSLSLSDPELQRKKRVASYKVYTVEGKMKGSLKKSVRWIKSTCNQVVHGWW